MAYRVWHGRRGTFVLLKEFRSRNAALRTGLYLKGAGKIRQFKVMATSQPDRWELWTKRVSRY